ncbi:MAG: EAL domain-containing protein, partial [Rubrivivax sp.]
MSALLAISVAVNLMVGVALLWAWRRDQEQRFSRDLGLAFLLLSAGLPGYVLFTRPELPAALQGLGGLLITGSVTGYLSLLVVGGQHLSGRPVSRRQTAVLVLVLALAYGSALLVLGTRAQVLNAPLHLVAGLAVAIWLHPRNGPERLSGLLLVLLGLVQFITAVGGRNWLEEQIAATTALRVALGLTLVFAAFTRSNARAQRLHERFFQLTERSHQGVGVMRGETVLYANPEVHRIYGVDDMQEHSRRWRDTTMPENERAAARERHRAILAGELEHAQWDGERLRLDGSKLQLRFSAWRIDWDGEPAEQIVVTDVTAEQSALSKLLHQATHDALTGLPNRSALLQRLRMLCSDGTPFALIVLDVDRFALFNEAHGPSVGDQVLVALAEALARWLAERAEVMRLGEDEFALLVCGDSPETQAAALCDSVRDMLQQPLTLPQHEFFLDVSMGIALHPETAGEPDALLRAANAAMHEAKRMPGTSQQRAEVRFEHGSGRLLHAEQSLRAGLEQQQFHLVYQPKVDAQTLAPLGFEALVRWQHGNETILPSDFIPAAENTGLIVPLGRHILALACAQLAIWRNSGMPWLPVAVNVSPLQLLEPGFPELVLRTLARHGVPPNALSLEITETAAVRHMEQAHVQIAALREAGIEVALDDFGVGFSSLNMLRSLPLHTVKIDRSLIEPMPAPEARAVVRTVCALAAPLHLKVVAEGVETQAQAAAAREAGCDQLQGYLFSPPLPGPDAAAWLAAQQ